MNTCKPSELWEMSVRIMTRKYGKAFIKASVTLSNPNEYMQAIRAVGDVCLDYDS